jgi:hypothetical protein
MNYACECLLWCFVVSPLFTYSFLIELCAQNCFLFVLSRCLCMWKHFASGAPAAFVVLLSSVGRQQPANLPSTVTTVGPGSCVADCHCPPVITCTAELVALSSAESAGQFWFNCALVACVLNLFCLAVGKWAYPFTVAGIGASWSVSLPGLPPAVSAASSVDLLDFDSAVVASPLALELPARVKFAAAAKAQLASVLAKRRDGGSR